MFVYGLQRSYLVQSHQFCSQASLGVDPCCWELLRILVTRAGKMRSSFHGQCTMGTVDLYKLLVAAGIPHRSFAASWDFAILMPVPRTCEVPTGHVISGPCTAWFMPSWLEHVWLKSAMQEWSSPGHEWILLCNKQLIHQCHRTLSMTFALCRLPRGSWRALSKGWRHHVLSYPTVPSSSRQISWTKLNHLLKLVLESLLETYCHHFCLKHETSQWNKHIHSLSLVFRIISYMFAW